MELNENEPLMTYRNTLDEDKTDGRHRLSGQL